MEKQVTRILTSVKLTNDRTIIEQQIWRQEIPQKEGEVTSVDFVKLPSVTIQAISNTLSTSTFKPTKKDTKRKDFHLYNVSSNKSWFKQLFPLTCRITLVCTELKFLSMLSILFYFNPGQKIHITGKKTRVHTQIINK